MTSPLAATAIDAAPLSYRYVGAGMVLIMRDAAFVVFLAEYRHDRTQPRPSTRERCCERKSMPSSSLFEDAKK